MSNLLKKMALIMIGRFVTVCVWTTNWQSIQNSHGDRQGGWRTTSIGINDGAAVARAFRRADCRVACTRVPLLALEQAERRKTQLDTRVGLTVAAC